MQTHIAQQTTTLATCWRIQRKDSTEYFFTDHDKAITYNSDSYTPLNSGDMSSYSASDNLAVDNLDVELILNASAIDETHVRAGLFDFANVWVFLINYEDVTMGILKLNFGVLGEVEIKRDESAKVEVRSLTQLAQQNIGSVITPDCRASLGDSQCKYGLWGESLGDLLTENCGSLATYTSVTTQGTGVATATVFSGATAFLFSSAATGDYAIARKNFSGAPWNSDVFGISWRTYFDSLPSSASSAATGGNDNDFCFHIYFNGLYNQVVAESVFLDLVFRSDGVWVRGSSQYNQLTDVSVELDSWIVWTALVDLTNGYDNTTLDLYKDGVLTVTNIDCAWVPGDGQNPTLRMAVDDTPVIAYVDYVKIGTGLTNYAAEYRLFNQTVSTLGATSELRSAFYATGITGKTNDYFNYGVLTWQSGANNNIQIEVKDHIGGATSKIVLFEPMPFEIATGDIFDITAGCDRLWTTCKVTFSNQLNFRGFPHVPGTDKILDYPSLK
jgi:hypothetical protein